MNTLSIKIRERKRNKAHVNHDQIASKIKVVDGDLEVFGGHRVVQGEDRGVVPDCGEHVERNQ